MEASASFNCPSFKYNSTTSNQICSCSNQTNFGPGLGWNPLIEDATSDKACSTRAAALPEFPAGEPSKIHKKAESMYTKYQEKPFSSYLFWYC